MPIDKAVEKDSLANIFSDLLLLATRLQNTRDYGDTERLRQRIIVMFQTAEQRGGELGIHRDSLHLARYAVAAFLDEMILSSPCPNKDQWSARPLQYEFFKEQTAGVEFFNRLDTIRRSLPLNVDLLEIYYLCLVLGFEGQYRMLGREKLKELVEDIAHEIRAKKGEMISLSPHGKRPDELAVAVRHGLPTWVVIVSSVAVVFFFYLILSFMMGHSGNSAARELKRILLEERN